MAQLNYKDLSKEQYLELEKILEKATEILTNETEVYYFLQELVNEVYAIVLCMPYVGAEGNYQKEQVDASLNIIKGISDLFFSKDEEFKEPSKEIIEGFSKIEGIQEELSYDITSLEEVLYQIDTNHRELVQDLKKDKLLNGLLLSRDLLSSSLFIDFHEVKDDKKVDKDMLDQEVDKLINDVAEFMEGHDRLLGRAVMANTLSVIPVFFNSHKEVMDYVRYSLEKCNDKAEKTACNIIIREMIKEF